MFGSDHPFKIHLILGAFCTLQNKNCTAETTADLTIFGISITQIDVFPYIIFIPFDIQFLCKKHLADGIIYS